MSDARFFVFVRSDRHQWSLYGTPDDRLSVASLTASRIVADGTADRAVVLEVSGRDAVPLFTYRYGTKAMK